MDPVMLTTKNKAFARSLKIAEKAAKSYVNLLLAGESGVGKEVFARFIHQKSPRADGDFVPVNCYSFSDELLEQEIFGHEKGSITGVVGSMAEVTKGLQISRRQPLNKIAGFVDDQK